MATKIMTYGADGVPKCTKDICEIITAEGCGGGGGSTDVVSINSPDGTVDVTNTGTNWHVEVKPHIFPVTQTEVAKNFSKTEFGTANQDLAPNTHPNFMDLETGNVPALGSKKAHHNAVMLRMWCFSSYSSQLDAVAGLPSNSESPKIQNRIEVTGLGGINYWVDSSRGKNVTQGKDTGEHDVIVPLKADGSFDYVFKYRTREMGLILENDLFSLCVIEVKGYCQVEV